MSLNTDINQLLKLPSNFKKIKLMTITSDDLNNSSFAFMSILAAKLKSIRMLSCQGGSSDVSNRIVLITTNESYSHYSSVAAKSFGLNLKTFRDDKRLIVLDLLTDLHMYLTTSGKLHLDKMIQILDDEHQNGGLLMIDDISIFLSLGVSSADIFQMINYYKMISHQLEYSIVIQSYSDAQNDSCEPQDEDLRTTVNSIISSSDVWIQLSKLSTGFSTNVDGVLKIRDFNSILDIRTSDDLMYHFKTMDRNTKILVPGTHLL